MIGSRISAYEVLSELGSGGMGSVYLAKCAEGAAGLEAGTTVALKVIHPQLLETPGFFKRFLREAQIGQQVQHENVVRTIDCDATLQDGVQQNFLVMEYVEGQTLRDLLEELERVPEELCRHVACEIAKGLAAIHEVGVVHRDIKPENVLITEEHVVKVMDLGVAHLTEEVIRLSQTGTFVGSVEYAAPEQFKGSEPADHRADLHALGVMLYELSTGQHPYRDADMHKLLANILNETPRKPGEVNPQLSPFFEEVVNTLIAKDRDARFADAALLARVMEEGEKSEWWKERAKALRIETKRPLRRIRVPRETALYGRDDDLANLHALFDKAKDGDGQVLLVEGEAGIGKTRLVDEFVGRLRQEGEDINFLFGSYPPGGAATAAGAFSEAYREQLGDEGSAPWLSQTPILVPAFDALLRGEPAPKDAEALTKDSLGTVFVHATRNLAGERPTIVLIDDLHFAPEDARSLFMALALAVPGHPILLVGTQRPGVDEAWVSNMTRLDHVASSALSRLGPKDLVNLLKDSFRSERLANELAAQIAVKSDGNPFFAFEIIRGLREGQFITQAPDGTWVSTQVIRDIKIPSNVVDLIQARLRDLSEEERELLDVASCCGFGFDPELVADVVGTSMIPALRAFGRIETRHRLVRSAGADLVFDHHQVQESLYAGLLERLRTRYHAAIGEALETREGSADQDPRELDGSLCVKLCEHYLKGASGEAALRYLDAALDHLDAGYLSDQAIVLADRALEVKGLLQGGSRVDVLLKKNAHLNLRGWREAQELVLAEARVLAEEAGDKAACSLLERRLGTVLFNVGRYEDAEASYERSVATCREIGDRLGEAEATGLVGSALRSLGRFSEAKAHQEHSLAISREIGHRPGQANAELNLGNVLLSLGRYEQAKAYQERALATQREIGYRRFEGSTLMSLGTTFLCLGARAEAKAHYEQSVVVSREVGDRLIEGRGTACLGNMLASLGRYKEAKAYYERALAISREIGDRSAEVDHSATLGRVFHVLGDQEEALVQCERSLATARQMKYQREEGNALYVLALVMGEGEESSQAAAFARQALTLRRQIDDGVADSLLQLGEFRGRAGDGDASREALDEAVDLLRQQQRKAELAQALALLANLPDGDAAEAETALQEAGDAGNMPETRYYLWKATGKPEHIAEAKRVLDYRVEHAPKEYRESMLKNVRLNREIMEAWEEHGEKDTREADE